MSRRPVFITGLGAVSAAGSTCAETLDSFRRGHRHAELSSRLSASIAKPVFEVLAPVPGDAHRMMRTFWLALQAAGEALADAGFDPNAPGLRVGVALGTTVACQLNDIEFYRTLRAEGRGPMAALDRYFHGNLAAAVSTHFGFTGPALTIANACSSGTDAIGAAMSWIRHGVCDVALAGGADELNRVPLAGFNALGIMSDTPCMPFDRDRRGLSLGEGAGIVLLEAGGLRTSASPARPVVTCAGYGTMGDAHHLTAPREDGLGLEAAIRRALSDASATPSDIGFINAHGTATPTNDAVEGSVLARVFGSDCLVSATKGYTGHTLGAAGGLEAVFSTLALREGWLPPSAGFATRDPAIPVEPVREQTPIALARAVSTSLAFGGNNSALVLERIS